MHVYYIGNRYIYIKYDKMSDTNDDMLFIYTV